MAVIKQGILGGFLGKVGSVVGGNFKGIATMRAMPLSVANPRTAAQVGNRTRFSYVTAFAGVIGTAFIQTYWNRKAQKMSGYNMFTSVNKDVFDSEGTFIRESVILSDGKIGAPEVTNAVFDISDQRLRATVDYNISGQRLSTDKLQFILVNPNGSFAWISPELPANTTNLDIPCDFPVAPGVNSTIYAVSKRADNTENSTTTWKPLTVNA